ncbi:hypothetical protein M9H77_02932 [Catharanthus roseus]|uniref:Uncharacterized protein n=1 Tax=Catharanthus roseus TaxID=4058 RepID=A0ACC0CA85_CATRO|nr:hypothetical protein M9H77_02932 [Catharanthus roseus]
MAQVNDVTERVNVAEGKIARLNTGKTKLDEIISEGRPAEMKSRLCYTGINPNHTSVRKNLSYTLSLATQVDHVTTQKLQVLVALCIGIILGNMSLVKILIGKRSDGSRSFCLVSTSINRRTQLKFETSHSAILRRHSATKEKIMVHGIEVLLLVNGVEDLKGFKIKHSHTLRGSLEELKGFNCVVCKGSLH